MELGAEEDARRTVELGHYDALGTVDHEGAFWGHVRYHAQVYGLLDSLELLVLRVVAGEF